MGLIEVAEKNKVRAAAYAVLSVLFLAYLAFRFGFPPALGAVFLPLLFASLVIFNIVLLARGALKALPAALPALLLAVWVCGTAIYNAKGAVSDIRALDLIKYAFVLLLVLPAGCALKDRHTRALLNAVSAVAVVIFGILFTVGLIAYLQQKTVFIPFFRGSFGLSSIGYLHILGRHHYSCAYLALTCFCAGLYLFSACKKIIGRILLIPFEILFAAVVILSTSRACLAAMIAACLIVLFIRIRELIDSAWVSLLCCACAAVLSLLLVMLFYTPVSEFTVRIGSARVTSLAESRTLTEHFGTLTGRTYIYKAAVPAFRTDPKALITGFDYGEHMDIINSLSGYAEEPHMHNGHLQMLMLSGIPGLLFLLWLTVDILIGCCRTVFTEKPLTVPERLVCLVPLALLTVNLLDCVVLCKNTFIQDGLFFLFCGYLLCRPDKRSTSEAVRK